MKRSLRVLLVSLGLFMVLGFTGCVSQSSVDSEQKQKTEELMREMDSQVGMPNITNFYEKKMAKEIFELRDDSKLICYAYTKSEITGKYVFEGRCIGYGLPYSVQYTNPERVAYRSSYGVATLPQADPNGLFMPSGLSATWIMLINEETGEREPAYYEPTIVVRQSKIPKRLCEEWSLPSDY